MVRKIDAPGLSWVRVSRSSIISAFLGISLGVVITSTLCYSGPSTDAVKRSPSSQPLEFFIVFVLGIAVSCLAFRSSPRRSSEDLPEIVLRRYFSGHPLPMIVFDVKTTNILAANRAACALYGYTSKELRGMSMDSVRLAQDAVEFRRKLDEVSVAFNAAGSAGDWTHLRKDGTELTVNVSYHISKFDRKKSCYIVCVDVSQRTQAQLEVASARSMLETLLNSVPQRIYWKNRRSEYMGCNTSFAKEAGLAHADDVRGLTDADMPWRSDAADARLRDKAAMSTSGGHIFYEHAAYYEPAKEIRWYAKTKAPLLDSKGYVVGILALHEDITTRKSAELALRLRSRALDACINAVVMTRTLGKQQLITYVNPAFERITGYRSSQAMGRDCRFLQGNDREQEGLFKIRFALETNSEVSTILRNYRADGRMFWSQLLIAPVLDEAGIATHHIAIVSDVTELVESRDRLAHQASYDSLTRLPNRALLNERLQQAMAASMLTGTQVAIVFLDIDHFKDVNDSLGHSVGDRLLQQIAARLIEASPTTKTVARYGGDEFIILLPDITNDNWVDATLAKLKATLATPLKIDEHEFLVDCSMGVSFFPRDGHDVETLVKRADAAMYEAKALGRNAVRRYGFETGARVEARLTATQNLRRAIRNREFCLYYQPQINIANGRVIAVEALIRWFEPTRGLVSPAEFIPVAEESGLIVPIGQWVITEVCSIVAELSALYDGLRVAINLSPRQFIQGDVVDFLTQTMSAYNVDPSMLELEITESTLASQATGASLKMLAAGGALIAIDDFGTGYSNLSSLKSLQPDRLKIDKSLINGIGVSVQDEALVLAVLALGVAFGAQVIAEGVETTQQRDFLTTHGCNEMQGFLFARPMPLDQLHSFLRQNGDEKKSDRGKRLIDCR